LLTLVCVLIVSKVDYYNSVLAGILGQLQDRLQSVLNAAAHLIFSLGDHAFPVASARACNSLPSSGKNAP